MRDVRCRVLPPETGAVISGHAAFGDDGSGDVWAWNRRPCWIASRRAVLFGRRLLTLASPASLALARSFFFKSSDHVEQSGVTSVADIL